MKNDVTATSNRECRITIPDGNYALQTDAGSVSQCLVHWQEAGQIYPERYSWGGRATTSTEGDNEFGESQATQTYGSNWKAGGNGEGVKVAPDYCKNPICGVCDWGDEDPSDNLVKGMETVWTFKRLKDDLYLILNGADGMGFRCFGFQTPDAPYPTMVAWQDTQMEAATGMCNSTTTECTTSLDCQIMTITIAAAMDVTAGMEIEQTVTNARGGNRVTVTGHSRGVVTADSTGTEITVRMESGNFAAGDRPTTIAGTATTIAAVADAYTEATSICVKEDIIVGEWVTDQRGVEYEDIDQCELNDEGLPTSCKLNYFCGHTTDANGEARGKMMANGGTVWNVQQLGCTKDPRRRWLCQRDPMYENKFLIRSLAGQDTNGDADVTPLDYECLYFPQLAGGQYTHPRRAPKAPTDDGVWGGLNADADGNTDNECGILPQGDETQEQALVANKAATWTLIPLPDY
jgi:hypothetical protein